MASIESLQIQNIRAFGGSPEVIKFFTPLTVIVGQNGCGKTTIIECLKYVTSGTVPPDSHSGQSFVHDPGLAGASEVKAQIRLRFVNRAGTTMDVHRTFKLSQLKTRREFRVMDGVLQTVATGSSKKATTHRCTDLDKIMPDLLGVSKAMLNNVIFCHQEESNWPLQDGTALKKRFDEIFESSRYTKALDDLRKQKKELVAKAKDLQREVEVLQERNRIAKQTEDDITNKQTSLAALQRDLDECEEQYLAVVTRISQLEAEVKATQDARQKLEIEKANAERLRQQLARTESDLDDLPQESLAELQRMSSNYQDIVRKIQDEMSRRRSKSQQLASALANLRSRHQSLSVEKGRMELELEQSKQVAQQFVTSASAVASKHGMARPANADSERARQFLKGVEELLVRRKGLLTTERQRYQAVAAGLEKRHNTCIVESEKLDSAIKAKDMDRRAAEQSLQDIDRRLARMPNNLRALTDVEARLNDKQAELERLRSADMTASLSASVREMEATIDRHRNSLSDLRAQRETLRTSDGHQHKLTDKRESLRRLEQEIDAEFRANDGTVRSVLGRSCTPADLFAQVNAAINARVSEVEHAEDALRAAEALVSERVGQQRAAEAQRKDADERYRQLNDGESLRQVRELLRIHGVQEENCDTLPGLLRDAIAKYEQRIKTVDILAEVMNKFSSVASSSHACPLCTRSCNATELQVLMETIATQTSPAASEERKRAAAEKVAGFQEHLTRIEAHLPQFRQWKDCKTNLTKLEEKINEIMVQVSALQQSCVEKRRAFEVLQRGQKAAEQLLLFATQLNMKLDSARRLNDEILELQSRMPGSGASRTAADIEREISETEQELFNLQSRRDTTQARIQAAQEQLNSLGQAVTALMDERSKIREQVSESSQLVEEQRRLTASIANLSTELRDMRARTPDLAHQLAEAQKAKEEGVREWTTKEDDMRRQIADLETDVVGLRHITEKLVSGGQAAIEARLAQVARDETEAKQQIQEKEREQAECEADDLQAAYESAQKALARNEMQILYRKQEAELEQSQANVISLTRKVESLSTAGATVGTELKSAQTRSQKIIEKRGDLGGRITAIRSQVNELQGRLNTTEFADVGEQHRHKLIEYETTQLAVEDVDTFYVAVDKALMRYHQLKIKEINRLIKDLWAITYRGQDIDSIEIRSDVEHSEDAASARRSFKYRVVMTKGGTELDMKGRCSAGQKVLACLVIRLALAEAFCVHCGILALDEPTTNLDEDNKRGFAQALNEIIAARGSNRNFQLIVITHDEDFVKHLGNPANAAGDFTPAQYYLLRRQESDTARGVFHTKILLQDWSEVA